MSTLISLEDGDTPESTFQEGDILFKIQMSNRAHQMELCNDEDELHLVLPTPYGKKIFARIKGGFDSEPEALRWGQGFLDEAKKFKP